jgi:two-component system LytT family response regulator
MVRDKLKQQIKALIVDDEPLARDALRVLLVDDPDIKIVGEGRNGREAITMIREHAPDLVFLDVQMPYADGFQVLEQLDTAHLPVIVFVTAYDEYALRAFESHALDYL